ncbi:MAG: PQQ-binding-like beta-propeller repeat protein [Planctomycetales bacterium]|nr:PQQ-binding-like beta-propeller repeat protein [Planctomycetales bacterium]
MKPYTILFSTLLLLLATGTRAETNWPEFRGPRGDGQAHEATLPTTWSETENIVWKTPIHDRGWSSPVIWGKQIWMATATADGKEMFAVCVDRESGDVLFDIKLLENEEPAFCHKFNSYASCTPAIEAGRVYMHFGSYGTFCLDTATGKTLWSRTDLPCDHWRGPGSSPIIDSDRLFVHYDGYDYQYIVALDKQTGKTIWKKDRSTDFGTDNGDLKKAYCTPLVIEVNGQRQLISPFAKATMAYDPANGDELWHIRYPGHSTPVRPLYGHGLVFLTTGFSKAEMYAVRPTGQGDVTESHVAWQRKENIPSKPGPLLIGDSLYLIDDAGVATCLDALTGEEIWKKRVGGNHTAAPLYADGKVYFFSQEGKTTVIAASRDYEVLATNELDAGFMASPAVVGNQLYLRTETHLYRIEQK